MTVESHPAAVWLQDSEWVSLPNEPHSPVCFVYRAACLSADLQCLIMALSCLSDLPPCLLVCIFVCLHLSLLFSFLSSSRCASNLYQFIEQHLKPPTSTNIWFLFLLWKMSQVTSKPMQCDHRTQILTFLIPNAFRRHFVQLFVWSIMHPLVHQVAWWDI